MIYIVPTDTCFGLGCSIFDQKRYDRIYTMKKRSKSKPLAVLVPTWKDLFSIANLTAQQRQFLVDYEHPWTLLTDVSDSFRSGTLLEDTATYPQVAIRVGELCVDERVYTEMTTPFFLTSANISDTWAPKNKKEIQKNFSKYSNEMFFLPWWEPKWTESDIFSFDKWTTSIRYVRKIS